MAVQPGLCQTWSESPKIGFLMWQLISSLIEFWPGRSEQRVYTASGQDPGYMDVGSNLHKLPTDSPLSAIYFSYLRKGTDNFSKFSA